jgi:hypothetical protein
LYSMFKILESVSVLMLALWLVLIKATWEKIISTSAVLNGCMTVMLYSLETSGYIEERFLSLWSTDWNSSLMWVKDLLSEEDKICINSSQWMSRDSASMSKCVAKASISVLPCIHSIKSVHVRSSIANWSITSASWNLDWMLLIKVFKKGSLIMLSNWNQINFQQTAGHYWKYICGCHKKFECRKFVEFERNLLIKLTKNILFWFALEIFHNFINYKLFSSDWSVYLLKCS